MGIDKEIKKIQGQKSYKEYTKLKAEHDKILKEAEIIDSLKSIITKECLINDLYSKLTTFDQEVESKKYELT